MAKSSASGAGRGAGAGGRTTGRTPSTRIGGVNIDEMNDEQYAAARNRIVARLDREEGALALYSNRAVNQRLAGNLPAADRAQGMADRAQDRVRDARAQLRTLDDGYMAASVSRRGTEERRLQSARALSMNGWGTRLTSDGSVTTASVTVRGRTIRAASDVRTGNVVYRSGTGRGVRTATRSFTDALTPEQAFTALFGGA